MWAIPDSNATPAGGTSGIGDYEPSCGLAGVNDTPTPSEAAPVPARATSVPNRLYGAARAHDKTKSILSVKDSSNWAHPCQLSLLCGPDYV
jgi:hypothetical protein